MKAEFTLAFQVTSVTGERRSVLYRHPGIRVQVVSELRGLYGTVRSARSGGSIAGAKVTLSEGTSVKTDDHGQFQFAEPKRGALSLEVTKPGYSPYKAVDIPFTGDGMRVDCLMEETFPTLDAAEINYQRYDDRSQGSTLMHVVTVPRSGVQSRVAIARSSKKNAFPHFETAVEIGKRCKSLVVLNGGYFDLPSRASDGIALGFFYADGIRDFTPFSWKGRFPVLGITSEAGTQSFQIVEKSASMKSNDWVWKDGRPVWDDNPRDGVSDVNFAIQCEPILLREDGSIPAQFAPDHYKHWARTAVGIDRSGRLILLVADGEGLHGCQGASMPQLAAFFRDVLKAETAMNLDGGGSTQLAVRTPTGMRLVNTLTAEHPRWLPNGRVQNFFIVQKE